VKTDLRMGTACFWRVQTYERLARKELPPCQVQLEEGTELEAFNVQLFEARARDPKVPRGKPFAKLSTLHLALPEASKITRNPPPLEHLSTAPGQRSTSGQKYAHCLLNPGP